MVRKLDKIVIGGGLYGLYAALRCGHRGERIVVLEADGSVFSRATYVNQARVHQGYHYPRSLSTAAKSAHYFRRFCDDFSFCINKEFDQIYGTARDFSWTNATQFAEFCAAADIPCEAVSADKYFQSGLVDGAFRTQEYTYDASLLRGGLVDLLRELPRVSIECSSVVSGLRKEADCWVVSLRDGREFQAPFVLNAAYASLNQILRMAGIPEFDIKYELCEISLCRPSGSLVDLGVTVMDGPFFSIMPFGKTGMHSLTSVSFTPHATCYEDRPSFQCQSRSDGYCSESALGNCNQCTVRPRSAFPYMASLARKYLRPGYTFTYEESLYSMKPILMTSEIDDSRPTVIKVHSCAPALVSVLSGKINTIYDLDEVLNEFR